MRSVLHGRGFFKREQIAEGDGEPEGAVRRQVAIGAADGQRRDAALAIGEVHKRAGDPLVPIVGEDVEVLEDPARQIVERREHDRDRAAPDEFRPVERAVKEDLVMLDRICKRDPTAFVRLVLADLGFVAFLQFPKIEDILECKFSYFHNTPS